MLVLGRGLACSHPDLEPGIPVPGGTSASDLHPLSVTKERTEVVLQGTAHPNASAPDAHWEEFEFKCKPGEPRRRPCLISPYHYRLDWLMWFAAFQVRAGSGPRCP